MFSFIICFMPFRTTHPTSITMTLLLYGGRSSYANKSKENLWWFMIDSTTYLQIFCFRWELVDWGFWLEESGIYMVLINMYYWLEMYLWFDKYSNLFIWVHVASMGVCGVYFFNNSGLKNFIALFFFCFL